MNPQLPLEGLTQPRPGFGEPGYVEAALIQQITAMREHGHIDDRHAGTVALARVAAQQVDDMGLVGRPSGRANMLRAAREVFELLPEVEQDNADVFSELLTFVKGEDATAQP